MVVWNKINKTKESDKLSKDLFLLGFYLKKQGDDIKCTI